MKTTTWKVKVFWGVFFFSLAASLSAGVNLKNGNFYITYADIRLPGKGHDLKLTRTYNSKSVTKGWFGVGWGSPFETRLEINSDGSVTVVENGSGAKTRFSSQNGDAARAEQAVNEIIQAMRKKGTFSADYLKSFAAKLRKNAHLRDQQAKKFGIKSNEPAEGVLYSNVRGRQKLHRTSNGYKRVHDDGKTDHFDKSGRLMKVVGKNYFFDLNYKKGRLHSIKDSEGKQIFFSWNGSGLVSSVWSGKKKANYIYDEKKLKRSVDAAGNAYDYAYDSNYNMKRIGYKDGSEMKIGYESKTQFVNKIVGRDGLESEYKYGSNPKNPDYHYWTTVSKRAIGGKSKPVVNRYEYEIKIREDGSEYIHKVITDVNGLRTETTYSKCCSLPLVIKKGKEVTRFKYNKKGLMTEKISSKGSFVRISYDKRCEKITQVKNNKGETNFRYDNRCRLSVAKNSKGESFLLTYELKGKITQVVYRDKSGKKEVLNFKYNSLGRPEEIAMKGVGKMNVLYDNVGKVKNVRSAKGSKVANKVTRTFLSLLAVVRPAGVNLNSI